MDKNNGQLVGLSLSFCVKDIARGRVQLEQVEKIIASTASAAGARVTSTKVTGWMPTATMLMSDLKAGCRNAARFFVVRIHDLRKSLAFTNNGCVYIPLQPCRKAGILITVIFVTFVLKEKKKRPESNRRPLFKFLK